ncbi:MAG: hypothetical protein U5R14_04765 [Gemmatimonadota bacterium]|nr:hypothetical protein [Gemmatimonadota bacterium]
MNDHDVPILTLEPLIQAVRTGLEGSGWTLSGLQKTTSHEFEGRWAGESTRSAYLFFHRDEREEPVEIDVYLDETSRGLTGTLALVVDLRDLGEAGPVPELLERLATLAAERLPRGCRTPLSLRFGLPDRGVGVGAAETEVRFKLRIPRRSIEEGAAAVVDLTGGTVSAFERLLDEPELHAVMAPV